MTFDQMQALPSAQRNKAGNGGKAAAIVSKRSSWPRGRRVNADLGAWRAGVANPGPSGGALPVHKNLWDGAAPGRAPVPVGHQKLPALWPCRPGNWGRAWISPLLSRAGAAGQSPASLARCPYQSDSGQPLAAHRHLPRLFQTSRPRVSGWIYLPQGPAPSERHSTPVGHPLPQSFCRHLVQRPHPAPRARSRPPWAAARPAAVPPSCRVGSSPCRHHRGYPAPAPRPPPRARLPRDPRWRAPLVLACRSDAHWRHLCGSATDSTTVRMSLFRRGGAQPGFLSRRQILGKGLVQIYLETFSDL